MSDLVYGLLVGIRYMTPLFLVLLLVETTELVFAVDSIPATVAVTAGEWRFQPSRLSIRAGEVGTLSVTNAGAHLYTLTVPVLGVDTSPLEPRATRDLTFDTPADRGRYEVICTFPGHVEAGMIGGLIVE